MIRWRRALWVVSLLGASCAGPQPLDMAIRSVDQQAYLGHLNDLNGDARSAYARWMAAENNTTTAAVMAEDARLSSTRNPFDARRDARAVSRGAVLYLFHCARCHGTDARGRGPSTLPDHPATDFKTFGQRFAVALHGGAPRKWFRVINEGSGELLAYPDGQTQAMPAFGEQFTREQIWLVITYLQSLEADGHAHDDKAA